jgi:hypothetical protein
VSGRRSPLTALACWLPRRAPRLQAAAAAQEALGLEALFADLLADDPQVGRRALAWAWWLANARGCGWALA